MYDGMRLVIRTTPVERYSSLFRGQPLEQFLECMACPASSFGDDSTSFRIPPPGLCAGNRPYFDFWAFDCPTVSSQRFNALLSVYYQGRMLPNLELIVLMESEDEIQHLILYFYVGHEATQLYTNDMPTTTNPVDGVASPVEGEETNVQETVTFHDDGTVVLKEYPKYVSIGTSFKDAALNQRTHEIENFLGRPILCASGVWSTTNVVGTQLQTIPLPATCLANAAYADKVRGFFGFRAKMVCRVQVNSQRFQQGRLLLHYLPQTSTMSTYRKLTALSSLVAITQQPRVDLNLNEDTEVRLEIPYVSNSLYYSMADGSFDFGTFYLTVYALLRTGSGATTCSYSVFCHFEDVEVCYPAVSQMGVKTLIARGGKSGGDVQDVELKDAGLGPLSGGLARVAGAGMILSEIPLLSSITMPVSWAAGIMSRAADALGFCKPANAGPTERRTLSTFAYMNNTNAIDNSSKMAIRSDNHVQMVPGFGGTDLDEMSFSYMLKIPAYFQTISWTTSQTVGTALATTGLRPASFSNTVTVSGQSLRYFIPMGYVANHFQWYRGSIGFKIKVIKTEFHSGRLQIAFFPGKNLATGVATLAASQYVFREVIDLRTASEITVIMPWAALTPYYRTADTYGLFDLRVINPLVAPDAMSTTVDVILEVFAGDDFEFACPVPMQAQPVLYSSQCGVPRFRSQTGVSATTSKEPHAIDESSVSPEIEPSLYCVGERVLSIRQLVKRFTTWYVAQPAIAAANSYLSFDPFANYIPSVGLTDGYKSAVDVRVDMLSYYAACFRFVRGGIRLKVIDPAVTNAWFVNTWLGTAANMTTQPHLFTTANNTTNGLDQPVVVVPSLSGGIELEMPYYNATHASHVRLVTSFSGSSDTRETTDNMVLVQINPAQIVAGTPTSYSPAMRVYRAAADDYSLGFFIGTPPLNVTSNGGPV